MLKQKPVFVLMSLLFLSGITHAFVIGSNVEVGGPDAVCFIAGGHPQPNSNLVRIEYSCSATLISPTQVLTAGHCVSPIAKDANMKIKVLCGYKGDAELATQQNVDQLYQKYFGQKAAPRPFSDLFKEAYIPASIYVNPKYKGGGDEDVDPSHDFAVINLPNASAITPIQVLSPAKSIEEFLDTDKSSAPSSSGHSWWPFSSSQAAAAAPSSSSSFQCSAIGYGLNSDRMPFSLLNGDVTTNDLQVSLSFERSPKGIISASQHVLLSSQADIKQWVEMDVAKMETTAAQEMGKLKPDDETPDDFTVEQFMFLNQRKLIKASVMPGDSGGPLVCRHSQTSPWELVGVASGIMIPPSFTFGQGKSVMVAVNPDKKLPIQVHNIWVTPDLKELTQKIWPN